MHGPRQSVQVRRCPMSVVRITEISSTSSQSFADAIQQLRSFVPLIAAVSLLAVALPARVPAAAAAGPKSRTLAGHVPAVVARGRAVLLGRHNPNDVLRLA